MIAVSSCVTPLGPGVSAAHASMHSAGPRNAMPYGAEQGQDTELLHTVRGFCRSAALETWLGSEPEHT